MCMDVGKWPSGTALAASRSEEWPTFILQYICSLFSHHYLFSARRASRPELTTHVPMYLVRMILVILDANAMRECSICTLKRVSMKYGLTCAQRTNSSTVFEFVQCLDHQKHHFGKLD